MKKQKVDLRNAVSLLCKGDKEKSTTAINQLREIVNCVPIVEESLKKQERD